MTAMTKSFLSAVSLRFYQKFFYFPSVNWPKVTFAAELYQKFEIRIKNHHTYIQIERSQRKTEYFTASSIR